MAHSIGKVLSKAKNYPYVYSNGNYDVLVMNTNLTVTPTFFHPERLLQFQVDIICSQLHFNAAVQLCAEFKSRYLIWCAHSIKILLSYNRKNTHSSWRKDQFHQIFM